MALIWPKNTAISLPYWFMSKRQGCHFANGRCWALVVAIWLLAGCTSHWQSIAVGASYDQSRDVCRKTIEQHGYTVVQSPQDQRLLASEWKTFLYPLRLGGYRSKVTIMLAPDSAVPPAASAVAKWEIRLQVQRQKNIATHDLMSDMHALWLADGYDLAAETALLEAIQSRLFLSEPRSGKQ